jgi:ribosomal protein S18 acetylase RimI-like enzyme
MAESPVFVRAARRDDIEVIARFNAAMALETEDKSLAIEQLRAGVAAVFDDPSRGGYRVAEVDGEVVACLLITHEWSDWRNGLWWWLQSVYVHPDRRGQGVFAAMYRNLRADAVATTGVCGLRLYVEQDNQRAQHVYSKLGMSREAYVMLCDEFGTAGIRDGVHESCGY